MYCNELKVGIFKIEIIFKILFDSGIRVESSSKIESNRIVSKFQNLISNRIESAQK